MLTSMATNSVGKRREAFNGLKRFILGTAMSYIDPDTRDNPLWESLGYPGPPFDEKPVTESFAFSKVRAEAKRSDSQRIILPS